MEWINIIVSAVCALLGALGGGSVFYFQQNKRLKAAEAERAEVIAHNEAENSEVERWRGLADRSEEQLKQAREHIQLKNKQVDNLYKEQHRLENDLRVLTNKYNSAMQVIDRIRGYYCTVVDMIAVCRLATDKLGQCKMLGQVHYALRIKNYTLN